MSKLSEDPRFGIALNPEKRENVIREYLKNLKKYSMGEKYENALDCCGLACNRLVWEKEHCDGGNNVMYSHHEMETLSTAKANTKLHETFDIDRIVFNDPATIVFWADGSKTVVKCAPGQKFNKYQGFCAAVTKRLYVHNSYINRIVESGEDQNPPKEPVKKSKKSTKGKKNNG